MNNLPTWIHPALIQAHSEKIENPVKDKTQEILNGEEEIKLSLDRIPQRAPSNSIISLLGFLSFSGLDKDAFVGKNVLDLGGGFGGVASNLEKTAGYITVVDPIFNEDIEKVLRKNIEDQEYFLYLRKEFLKNDRTKSHIHAQIFEGEIVLEEMKWWLNYNPDKFQNVIRNPSFAENIDGVEDESEDFVFCNYVLSKETIDIEKAVKEINRILKSGGKLIYCDYKKDEKIIEELKRYFSIDIISDDKDGIVIICTKK